MELLEASVEAAFAEVPPPPKWCIVDSLEGEEPALVARAFQTVRDWRGLSSELLDSAPDGYGTALSFFSDEAFRFFLPAYLIADLRGQLVRVDLVFHLTHGLESRSKDEFVNPERYGERRWYDQAIYRFSVFNREQRSAISRYLQFKAAGAAAPVDRLAIQQALQYFWTPAPPGAASQSDA